MDKDPIRSKSNENANAIHSHRIGSNGLLRSSETTTSQQPTPDFVLQWGNRKRPKCMKVQVRDGSTAPVHRVQVSRRVVRAGTEETNQPSTTSITATNHGNGYFNLRQRTSSPRQSIPHRSHRDSDSSIAMRVQRNGVVRGLAAKDGGTLGRRDANENHHHRGNNNKSSASSDTAQDVKKGGRGGSSSGSGEEAAAAAAQPVWPPKFVIALTNKEKEEDFIVFKGSKLPQRPKKRAKLIQRTLNLVSPGTWLCDLTLERYEVREKKISKKRPRGLKAMGNMDSDSE